MCYCSKSHMIESLWCSFWGLLLIFRLFYEGFGARKLLFPFGRFLWVLRAGPWEGWVWIGILCILSLMVLLFFSHHKNHPQNLLRDVITNQTKPGRSCIIFNNSPQSCLSIHSHSVCLIKDNYLITRAFIPSINLKFTMKFNTYLDFWWGFLRQKSL